jgi:hypothetical protein
VFAFAIGLVLLFVISSQNHQQRQANRKVFGQKQALDDNS